MSEQKTCTDCRAAEYNVGIPAHYVSRTVVRLCPKHAAVDALEAALQRNRQGYKNILELRKLDSAKWGQADGYGGRYGALTREEIEGVIAEIDAALALVKGAEMQNDKSASAQKSDTLAVPQRQEAVRQFKSIEDWRAEAELRFGADPLSWRFVCPVCKHEASVADWKAVGASEGEVAFSCVGRHQMNARKAFEETGKGPCNYAGGGLFRLNPISITGREHIVFDFAPALIARADAERPRDGRPEGE